MSGRANVAGSLQASQAHRENPYFRMKAPGVIKAEYDARAAQMVQQGAYQLAGLAVQAGEWAAGKDMREAKLQNTKLLNDKMKLENQSLKLNFASEMSAYKVTYDELVKAGGKNIPSFEDWLSNEVNWATELSNNMLNVDKDNNKTNGKQIKTSSETVKPTENLENKTAVDEVKAIEIDESNIESKTESNEKKAPVTFASLKAAMKDRLIFNQNFTPSMQQFDNQVKKVGNIDKEYNPVEFGVAAWRSQNSGNPNAKPKSSFDENGRAVAVFEYTEIDKDGKAMLDDDGNAVVRSVSVPMKSFEGDGKFWSPIEVPETFGNFIQTNGNDLKNFAREYGDSDLKELSDVSWNELENLYNAKSDSPHFVKSLNNNLQTLSKGKFTEIVDADGNGTVDGKDFVQMIKPFVNTGRVTAEEISIEKGRQAGITANVKSNIVNKRAEDKAAVKSEKQRTSALNSIQNVENEITEAITGRESNLLSKLTGVPASDINFVDDKNGNVTGFEVIDRGQFKSPSDDTVTATYDLNNNSDLKALSRSVFKERGTTAYSQVDPYLDSHFDNKTKITETVESIPDGKGEDGKFKLGKTEAKIKKDFGVKKLHELPIEVGNQLVKRQIERDGINTRTDLLTYLDIDIPEGFDFSMDYSQVPNKVKEALNPYRNYWRFTEKK